MLSSLEKKFIHLIRSPKKSAFGHTLCFLLLLCSIPYRLVVALRNYAFDHGFLSEHQVKPVVISIGNLVMGGTGKTPVTLMLATELLQRQYSIAVLSRGYRSQAEHLHSPIRITESTPSEICGDEPLLLLQRQPEMAVFVGKDRVQAATMAAESGCNIILLDDGMQHRRLARTFNIVVMDAHDPFGQGFLFPRGFLREPPSNLKRADLIILNNLSSAIDLNYLHKQISTYTEAPIVATCMQLKHIKRLSDQQQVNIHGQKVALFCGLANPHHFRELVKKQGATIISETITGDHRKVPQETLEVFAEKSKASGAEYLICTEKDRVKLSPTISCILPIVWAEAELKIVSGKEQWQHFVAAIEKQTQ